MGNITVKNRRDMVPDKPKPGKPKQGKSKSTARLEAEATALLTARPAEDDPMVFRPPAYDAESRTTVPVVGTVFDDSRYFESKQTTLI